MRLACLPDALAVSVAVQLHSPLTVELHQSEFFCGAFHLDDPDVVELHLCHLVPCILPGIRLSEVIKSQWPACLKASAMREAVKRQSRRLRKSCHALCKVQ